MSAIEQPRLKEDTHHHGVDARVYERKHPDRGRHVAHSGPHAHHGACVVVGLEGGASLSFGNDDGGIEDLVELGEVEEPTPEGKAFVPEPSNIRRVWNAIAVQMNKRVLGLPLVECGVVGGRIAESSRAVDLAQRVDGAYYGVALGIVGKCVLQGAHHGNAGDEGVDGQKDIMSNDEGAEGASLADCPGLVSAASIVGVQRDDRCSVHGGDGQGNLVVERGVVDGVGDGKRVLEGESIVRGRNQRRSGVWREFEDRPRGQLAGDEGGTRA
jgi:hypothetical protein